MCLILFSYDLHPVYRLVLAANRDEFYSRPTRILGFWEDFPEVLAGRDLKNQGTWLGITLTGRMAAITNFRDPASVKPQAPSRGILVSDFLTGKQEPKTYLKAIQGVQNRYNGFNILVGTPDDLYYFSNKTGKIQKLRPGIYGLSNHLLNTPWPKVQKGKRALKAVLSNGGRIHPEAVLEVLQDRSVPPEDRLPDTGIGLDMERVLAPLFITSPDYGTRSSSAVLIERNGKATFIERTFEMADPSAFPAKTVSFEFEIRQKKRTARAIRF